MGKQYLRVDAGVNPSLPLPNGINLGNLLGLSELQVPSFQIVRVVALLVLKKVLNDDLHLFLPTTG